MRAETKEKIRQSLLSKWEGKRKKRVCRSCGKEYEWSYKLRDGSTKMFCCKDCHDAYKKAHPQKHKKEKVEISDYYKKKGFERLYIATNKEPRRVATLRKANGEMTSMSYAKYLYTSYYKCDIAETEQVDHINGDRMDDRIENLQVISGIYNRQKDHQIKEMILLKCPVCGCDFLMEKTNYKKDIKQCCSRKCGYEKMKLTLQKTLESKRWTINKN